VNAIDIALIAVLVIAGLGGFLRGFVQSVLAIAAWVGAVLVTMYVFPYAAPLARRYISLRIAADIAAGAVLFIGSLVVLAVVRNAIARMIRGSALSALDRSLGFVFGVIFGAVLLCVAYFGASWAAGPRKTWPDWARESKGLPVVESLTLGGCALGPPNALAMCRKVLGNGGASRQDIERQFERLTAPTTKPPAEAPRPGYSPAERRELDRLFDSTR
jgi:membrane protein required for colicin V production